MIYLDYAATTPIDPRVAERDDRMSAPERRARQSVFGRATSTVARARALVEQARAQVAAAIGAQPESIVWTSGATESDNLAIFGVARFKRIAAGTSCLARPSTKPCSMR